MFKSNKFWVSSSSRTDTYNDPVWIPDLCASCRYLHSDIDRVEMCNLIKAEGREDAVFICVEYDPVSSEVDKESLLRELFRLAGIHNR